VLFALVLFALVLFALVLFGLVLFGLVLFGLVLSTVPHSANTRQPPSAVRRSPDLASSLFHGHNDDCRARHPQIASWMGIKGPLLSTVR